MKAGIQRTIESKESSRIRDGMQGVTEQKRLRKEKALNDLKELGPPPKVPSSKMSMTLLQNYILAICLMKNIALRFLTAQNPSQEAYRSYKAAIRF